MALINFVPIPDRLRKARIIVRTDPQGYADYRWNAQWNAAAAVRQMREAFKLQADFAIEERASGAKFFARRAFHAAAAVLDSQPEQQ